MLTIDGLVSGIDTQAIIDGLLEVSQSQIDRLKLNKSEIVAKQTAFNGIEAQLLSLRGKASSLGRSQNNVLEGKIALSGDENSVQISANSNAINGVYSVTVDSLAATHQIASNTYATADAQITEGTLTIQVGNESATTITIDSTNNSVQGLVYEINSNSDDAFASLVTDANGTRILLTGRNSGASEIIQITNNLGPDDGAAIQPDFSGTAVQDPADAIIRIGSGAGAISVNSKTNQFENVIEGLTFNVSIADASKPINITVKNDTEASVASIQGFVDAFNSLMTYIDSQSEYNSETDQAGTLLGNRSAIGIQNDIRNKLIYSVPGVDADLNQLSAIGLKFNDAGQLFVNSAQLTKVLNGEEAGVDIADVKRLFALDGLSTNTGIDFILGSTKTEASGQPYQVDITQAAERATLTGTALASSVVIDSSNNTFSVSVDGLESGTLTLADGTYTHDELSQHLESVINGSNDLKGATVNASIVDGKVKLQSESFGSQSELSAFGGTSLADLGFTTSDFDEGQDVVGRFLVDGEIEEAIGSGRVLNGSPDNANTADIQLRVTLSSSQISSGNEADLTVTRGFASQLDQIIGKMLDPITGRMKTVNESFEGQIESVEFSIEKTEALIETKTQQLVSEFIAMETALSNLQSQSNFLAAQLGQGLNAG